MKPKFAAPPLHILYQSYGQYEMNIMCGETGVNRGISNNKTNSTFHNNFELGEKRGTDQI